MVYWCEGNDISKTSRATDSSTAQYIPTAKNVSDQKDIIQTQIGQTLFVQTATALLLARCLMPLMYVQNSKHANLGPSSPGFKRLECNNHSNGMNQRPDLLTKEEPTKIPICDNTPENVELKRILHECIIMYLVEILGMDPDDEKFVQYYTFLWLSNSGMGYHADAASNKHKSLFFIRLSIQIGDPRMISFKVMQFEDNEESATHVYNDVQVDSINTRDGADMYVMTMYGSGVHPACWADEKKKKGIVVKHQVERTKTGNTMNIILDVPFRSLQDMLRAVEIVKLTFFVLPTEESMNDYNLLLEKVGELREMWNSKE